MFDTIQGGKESFKLFVIISQEKQTINSLTEMNLISESLPD